MDIKKLLIAFTLLTLGCAGSNSKNNEPSWAGKMQTTARSFQELLPFLYNEDKFQSKKNSLILQKKIENYADSIHHIDKKFAQKILGDDPYIQKSLQSLKELTERSLNSFKRGDKRNAQILLKATTNTCFKCHTRQNMGPQSIYWKNFNIGQLDINPIEKAHILVSMRQYEDAKAHLRRFFAESEDQGQFDLAYENALHYYLMISMRGQDTLKPTMDFIQSKILIANTPTHLHYTLKHWHKDLKYWSNNPQKLKPTLKSAKGALKRNANRYSERNLVNDLVASSLLHQYLMKEPNKKNKAKAYLLLGKAYDELIIEGFWDLPEVYYEMCIDYVPKSRLAKTCFQNLKENVTIGYSGSRGTMIPSQEYKRLEVLRKKAGL